MINKLSLMALCFALAMLLLGFLASFKRSYKAEITGAIKRKEYDSGLAAMILMHVIVPCMFLALLISNLYKLIFE